MTLRRTFPRPVVACALAALLVPLGGCGSTQAPVPASSPTAGAGDAGPTTPRSAPPTGEAGPTTAQEETMTTDAPQELGPGDVVTPEDDGATVRLAPGEEATLRLPPPWDGAVPSSSDPSVLELVPVDHFADPGYAELSLLAHEAGEAEVEVTGDGSTLRLQVVVTP